MRRVLVVGEGPDQAKALAFRLGLLGIEASASAAELTLAIRSILTSKPHLILLDGSSTGSRDVFKFIYDVTDVPVVVLGHPSYEDELVWYLEQGAADFVSAGTSPTLIVARISAILRRCESVEPAGVLEVGSLQIDTERHLVLKDGDPVQLTPTEFRILKLLAENAGKACPHRMLLERVWGEEFSECSHYLRLYIGYLRQKLEDDPRKPAHLLTEWGVGYRLVPEPPPVSRRLPRRAGTVPV